jgi:thioredoxin 1
MDAKELSDALFADEIRSGVTLVDFWAPWCGPCKIQGPILDRVAAKIGDKATIAKVNVDDYPAPASQFSVRGIPTLILFKDGAVVQQFVGVQQEATLTNAIEAALN